MMRSIARVLAFFIVFTLYTNPGHAQAFHASSMTLDNGLRVVVVENHRAPVVSHMLWIAAGGADEPYGTSGIAHYLEHLMFKGTKDIPNGEYSRRIAQTGGNENAFTTHDYTAFFAEVSNAQLPLVMQLEADRLAHLQFDEKLAKPELAVVMDEKRQRVDSAPYALFFQQMDAALFVHHPYSRPVIGWPEEIEKLTIDDARKFYERWYKPGRMVVVVSGDVKPADVFALAKKSYGAIPKADTPPRARVMAQRFKGKTRVEAMDGRAQETLINVDYRAPSRRLDAPTSYALEVLQELLSGSEAAYLPNLLIKEKALVNNVEVSYEPNAYDQASFTISVTPKPNVAADKVFEALHAALQSYAETPPAADVLESAKKSLQRQFILQRDSLMAPAYAIGMALSTGDTLEDVEAWPEHIAAVTPIMVQNALKTMLAEPQVEGALRPDPNAAKTPATTPAVIPHGEPLR